MLALLLTISAIIGKAPTIPQITLPIPMALMSLDKLVWRFCGSILSTAIALNIVSKLPTPKIVKVANQNFKEKIIEKSGSLKADLRLLGISTKLDEIGLETKLFKKC